MFCYVVNLQRIVYFAVQDLYKVKMPCDIYLATDIEALDALANKTLTAMKSIKLTQAYRAADKLFTYLYMEPSDEEKSYIHMTRFIFMMNFIYNTEGDAKYLQLKYASQKLQIEEEHRKLRGNLIKRYIDINKTSSKKPATNEVVDTRMEAEEENVFETEKTDRFVTSNQLYMGCSSGKNILIMDVRSKNEFEHSQLKLNTVINIDEAVVVPGLSANKLGEKLENPVKEVYDKRNSFEYIILVDSDTTQDSYMSSRLKILFIILTEWDFNTIYKNPPYILKGGYMDFVDRYPTYSTNPNIVLKHKYSDLDELLHLDGIQYPDEFSMKDEMSTISMETDNIYNSIIDNTVELLRIENKLLDVQRKFYDPNNASIKNKIENEIALLTTTKSDMVTKNKNLNITLKILLEKRPRENFHKKAEIGALEYQIVVVSRQRRKLIDANRVEETPASSSTPTHPQIPPKNANVVGDTPSVRIHPDMQPQVPTIDRNTKPKRCRYSIKENAGLVGLANIKNTCYMNSIIQCLRYLPSIKNYFMHYSYEKDISQIPPSLIGIMGDLIKKLWTSTDNSICPTDFYNRVARLNPTFGLGNHEDASEFFMFVFNKIFEDTALQVPIDKFDEPKYQTLYDRIQYKTSFFVPQFFHQIETTCICDACNHRCLKYDIENTIMVPMPEDGHLSIEEMFNDFLYAGGIGDLFCKDCGKKGAVVRQFTFIPKVVAFLLKRYVYSYEKGYPVKINHQCDFPLDNFHMGKVVYKLWCVSLHQGTVDAGHYTAACLNHEDGMWYEFNDDIVRPIDINSRAVKEKVYMLFYESHHGSPTGFREKKMVGKN